MKTDRHTNISLLDPNDTLTEPFKDWEHSEKKSTQIGSSVQTLSWTCIKKMRIMSNNYFWIF